MPKKNRFTFLLVVILFAIPMIAAWWVFSHPQRWATKTVNHGVLIAPPIKMLALAGSQMWPKHWLLVYVNPQETCKAQCQQVLYVMRQVRLALGKNQDHVLRVYLTFKKDPIMQTLLTGAGTQALVIDKQALQQFLGKQDFGEQALTEGQLWLVDPQGWLMMHYPLNFRAKDLLADLNRLLQVNN